MRGNVRLMLGLALGHAVAAAVFLALVDPAPLATFAMMLKSIPAGMALFVELAWWSLPLFALALVLVSGPALKERLPEVVFVLLANSVLFVTFVTVKASLPLAVPFWADAALADLDVALHGTDPWRLTHAVMGGFPVWLAKAIYTDLWYIPAMYLPVLLCMFDADRGRVRRYMILHFVVWAGLGNLLALAVLSAGPVYYDALLGGERFAGLTRVLAESGITGSEIGQLQAKLWDNWTAGTVAATSGISAFPSVHVAMATVFALYLTERVRWLAPAMLVYLALFTALSVHLGWHYAVDGYASILLVVGAWAAIRRAARRRVTAQAGAGAVAEGAGLR